MSAPLASTDALITPTVSTQLDLLSVSAGKVIKTTTVTVRISMSAKSALPALSTAHASTPTAATCVFVTMDFPAWVTCVWTSMNAVMRRWGSFALMASV